MINWIKSKLYAIKKNFGMLFLVPMIIHIIFAFFLVFNNLFYHIDFYKENTPHLFTLTNVSKTLHNEAVIVGFFTYCTSLMFFIYYSFIVWSIYIYNNFFSAKRQEHQERLKNQVDAKNWHVEIQPNNLKTQSELLLYDMNSDVNFSLLAIGVIGFIFTLGSIILSNDFEMQSHGDLLRYALVMPFVFICFSFSIFLLCLVFIVKLARKLG